ncbi:hypothetical protein P4S83_02910 [Aneurinibacillus thermoaerophilus]|uniref:hypothetical protein n=1 Tax=Aneurinibacillus TaxID=55079 RepID=UPI000B2E924E|nr:MULTISPECIES: hypothetical protein [Aneurinibacillus]MED0676602.1 hypothetical protein [Aneurinibacillus thermoaerophilus]MED0677859.1 hypothetical protein [Aneurinibacillus thermoaerophilus]MED0762935.1 hypothetical protein [Aneurinibacillus thermoaerophilus]
MKQVKEIENRIAVLSREILLLKKQLRTIQDTCKHDFKEDAYVRTCKKCGFSEALYY